MVLSVKFLSHKYHRRAIVKELSVDISQILMKVIEAQIVESCYAKPSALCRLRDIRLAILMRA